MSTLSLEGVELSNEARAQLQSVLDENQTLRRKDRESSARERISELEKTGLKDRPGALKLYRQVMLSDDGGPAIILFSDDESKKERLTALEILDRFITALEGEGGAVFSDQHLASPNDQKPPADPSSERPFEERLSDAHAALYGNRQGRRINRTQK